jgi:catechol 2,3-dioxygenase-like lactoylglutathione lyase family enzyme
MIMAMGVRRLDHVNVTVPKALEGAAKRFYGEVLGLTEIPKPGEARARGGAWYACGEVQLHLSLEEPAAGQALSRRHVCVVVEDLAVAERTCATAGLTIEPDDRPIPGWSRFYVRDPGGNRIEVAGVAE